MSKLTVVNNVTALTIRDINAMAKTAIYSRDIDVLESLIKDAENLKCCKDAPIDVLNLIHMHSVTSQYEWIKEKNAEDSTSELFYQKTIIDNFKDVFPQYALICEQYKTKAGGFIDILAKDIESGRPVIIELKLGAKNCARQLYGYAVDFYNPILVSVTEKDVVNKQDDIKYVVYSELLPFMRNHSKQMISEIERLNA